jgi:hypothetical protein
MNQLVEKEVRNLIEVGEKLVSDASRAGDYLPHDRVQELISITARGGRLISRLYGDESHYFAMFKASTGIAHFNEMHSNHYRHVSDVVGLFKAVEHDIQSGLLQNFRNLVQAEIFVDFLEMAEHLLSEGYKDPAAVILGAVLEDSLRKIAGEKGVPTIGPKGKPLTIDPLNAAVAKAGVYGPLVQKQITSWANLRNDAAHGHFGNYDAGQVQQMQFFVQKFCADYLR